MGILIAFLVIALGGFAIGIAGGVIASRTHQVLLSAGGTVVCYYLLAGIPWALLIMDHGGPWLRSFAEAFVALAKTLLLLGLLPLLITFALSAWLSR